MPARADLLAGATTAAVVIPQSMAYATIAGLPVQVGLYTALVPLVAYALIGTSRALSVSTTSTLTGALLVSMGMLIHALDHPELRIAERGEVLTLRLIGSLYFANVQRVRRRIIELVDAEQPDVLLLDLSAMPRIDVTALSALPAFDRDLERRGVTLQLVGLNERPLELLRRSPAHDGLRDRVSGRP